MRPFIVSTSLIRAVITILAIPKRFSAAKYLRTKLTYEYRVKSTLSVDQIRKWAMIHGNAS